MPDSCDQAARVDQQALVQSHVATLMVREGASIIGKTPKEAHFRSQFDVSIIGVQRSGHKIEGEISQVQFQVGDVLAVLTKDSFDPFAEMAKVAQAKGAWLHIDGAFGLWARATKTHGHLGDGIELADSWSVDGHKWLQTPYDCAYAIVKDREAHVRAMRIPASYLPGAGDGMRNPSDVVPELSRRARGFSTWAMIRRLGAAGIAEMVSRHCALARRFAQKLSAEADVEILNDVALNQVAVHFGSDAETRAVIAKVQSDAVCFVGGAQWRGKAIMRISVTNENTTEADVDRSVEAMLSAWRSVRAAN